MGRDSRSPSRRRRKDSRSPSRRRDRGRRKDSRSRSPPRRRPRSRGRAPAKGDTDLKAWGNKGTIVDLKSGFGFIRPHAGQVDGRDLYFHATGCAKGTSYNELHVNDEVFYEVGIDDRRKQSTAIQVKLASGGRDGSKSKSRSGSRG